MTKEQEAIEYLKESVLIYKNTIPKISESIETVLSMLKEKDEKIEYYKKQKDYDDQFKHELLEQIRCLNLDNDKKDKELEKKDKIIDLMTKAMDKIQDPQVCKYCDNKINLNHGYCIDAGKCKEGIKQYFERKATNNG